MFFSVALVQSTNSAFAGGNENAGGDEQVQSLEDAVEFLKKRPVSSQTEIPPIQNSYFEKSPYQAALENKNDDELTSVAIINAFNEAAFTNSLFFISGNEKRAWQRTPYDPNNADHVDLFKDKFLPVPNRIYRWKAGSELNVALLPRYSKILKIKDYQNAYQEVAKTFASLKNDLEKATGLTIKFMEFDGWSIEDDETEQNFFEWQSQAINADILIRIDVTVNPHHPRNAVLAKPYQGDHSPTIRFMIPGGIQQSQQLYVLGTLAVDENYNIKKANCNEGGAEGARRVGNIPLFVSHCLVASLGLPNVMVDRSNSSHEMLLLAILYDQQIKPGAEQSQVQSVLPSLIQKLRKQEH